MSGSDYNLFWNETVRQLMADGNLSEQEHDMWFRNMKFLKGNNESITLAVPSKFYKDQVKQRYLDMLINQLFNLTGSSLNINFEVVDSKPPVEEKRTENKTGKKISEIVSSSSESVRKPHRQLRRDYDFEGFVIGNNNSFAASAAQAIGANPGGAYNPFLIYGGVGLGKTHLMQSIGNFIHYSVTDKKVVYITAETFINEFIHSIKSETQSQFKNKYRKVDVLLIDDIHDLQNKKETQEELFHTFNALYDAKKQLVFTCDRPPSELKNFTDRLKSRFERGLNVDLQPPNFETRYAILRKKLETISITIPDEVLELIARNITTNIRDLEASLTKMVAYADLVGKKITVEIAQQQLKGAFTSTLTANITIDRVQRVVAEYFNVTPADLKGKKRTKQVTFPRQVAMFIIREITDYSTTEIGLEFGGRDHTTVMHSCTRIEDRMKGDPTLEPTVGELIRSVKESR
ncbi:MAG: chromosomal replication initiator protein DnaA [Spirochaetes bacterium]|nr:MAG: chromosomal replication initiator protein DnaA [Spirochaetota bacterium]RKX87274.1 MAG: chromosomal replication initiator protein DnaA [Spirochaetota bacterium]RKX95729.1 MAG: chromosomal replication initiator protein DnaA [Spirochaetota bacterium]